MTLNTQIHPRLPNQNHFLYAPQTIASFSLPALRANLGMCTYLPVPSPRRLECRLRDRVSSYWGSASGSRTVRSQCYRSRLDHYFATAHHMGVQSGQGDVVGWWKCPGLFGPTRSAGLDTCRSIREKDIGATEWTDQWSW